MLTTSNREKLRTKEKSREDLAKAIDFKSFLSEELVRRCKANPRYSLRAFSRFLGIQHSRLSKVLRGERPVSQEFIGHCAQRLNLSPVDVDRYRIKEIEKKHGSIAAQTSSDRNHYLKLSQDAFESIEDWRHYAILELMNCSAFIPDVKWISRALGIHPIETKSYIDRLQRIGLLKIGKDGTWHDPANGFRTHILSESESSAAHRRSQASILDLARQALANVPMDQRDQSSMMMATSKKKMAEAKIKIKKFRRELCDFLEDCDERDAVYQLSVSLFPLIQVQNQSPKKRSLK